MVKKYSSEIEIEKRKDLESFLENVVYIDIETSGLEPKSSEILELGAIKVKDSEILTFHSYIKNNKLIPRNTFDICSGLTMKDLENAPNIKEVSKKFIEFIEDFPLICHNKSFEKKFLDTYLLDEKTNKPIKNDYLCSMELISILEPGLNEFNLNFLKYKLCGDSNKELHRGLEDSIDTLKVVNNTLLRLLNSKRYEFIISFFKDNSWEWIKFLKRPKQKLKLSFKDDNNLYKDSCGFTITKYKNSYVDILKNKKLWDKYFNLNYEVRKEQLDYAKVIENTFKEKEILLAEAPTGLGKSFAYLVISILYSYFNKKHIFISTATKGLQKQLLKEIPKLLTYMGINVDNFIYDDIKGVDNYICLKRAYKYIENKKLNGTLEEKKACLYISNLIYSDKDIDIDNLNYWVVKNFEKMKNTLENIKCVDKYSCSLCKYDNCLLKRKISNLKKSNLTIINHHLFSNWPYSDVEIENIIFDEAHNLKDIYLSSMTDEFGYFSLKTFLNGLYNVKTKQGYLLALYKKYNTQCIGYKEKIINRIKKINTLLENKNKFINIFMKLTKDIETEYDYQLSIPRDISNEWMEFNEYITKISILVKELKELLKDIIEKIEDVYTEEGLRVSPIYNFFNKKISELTIFTMITNNYFSMYDKDNCYHLEIDKNFNSWKIVKKPFDIKNKFKEDLKDKKSCIMTSATLSVKGIKKGEFTYFKELLGLDFLNDDRKLNILKISHIFDYKNKSVFAIPTDVSPFNYKFNENKYFIKDVSKYIEDISISLNGKTLVLFPSLKRRNLVYEKILPTLNESNISLLTSSKDIERLRDSNNTSVLLGSRGLYEGVDIKGEGLKCVIIEKVPNNYTNTPYKIEKRKDFARKNIKKFKYLSLSANMLNDDKINLAHNKDLLKGCIEKCINTLECDKEITYKIIKKYLNENDFSINDRSIKAFIEYLNQIVGVKYYMEYELPETIIRLKQMVGRLIRSNNDYGYVFILNGLNNNKTSTNLIKRNFHYMNIEIGSKDLLLKSMKENMLMWESEGILSYT
ncbi:MAG: DEAD/DEAH box helicase [Firmicutes bacterium]|nr:DEAD/DEAH box helicase [Bacillota bacterium]